MTELNNTDTKVIKHSSNITFAKYDFSPLQMNLFFVALGKIQEKDVKLLYRVHVSEIEKDKKNFSYQNIFEATKKFMKSPFYIKTKDGFILATLFASIEYIQGEGMIEIEFSQKMKEFLLNLRNNFTRYKLAFAMRCKSQYAKRFYMILSHYKDTGWMMVSLDELRDMLMLQDKYRSYNMFKSRVLITAQKELNELTDINFKFKEIKTGKRITHLRFDINDKSLNYKIDFNNSTVLERLITRFKLPENKATDILRNVPETDIRKTLQEIELKFVNRKIENLPAYTLGTFNKKFNLNLINNQ